MTNYRNISSKVKKDLFLISGGRCEKCGNPVIDIEGGHSNICAIAHIYGLNAGSARYEAEKSQTYLNSFDNLMVLCENCHKMIDSKASKYTAKQLKVIKDTFEKEAINEISSLENKTNIGGHIDYKDGQKLLNFFSEDDITKIENLHELSKLLKSGDENAVTANSVLELIKGLSDLNIDSRQALLKIVEEKAKNGNGYCYSYTYWNSCYGQDAFYVLEPLNEIHYIDTDGFHNEYDEDRSLEVTYALSLLIDFMQKYEIPFEDLIITRNYSVIDG